MAEDLVLDTAIRDWVLIPLSIVMVLIGVLRYFVSKIMRSHKAPDQKIVREGQVVIRARHLKSAANFIPAKSFRARKTYFTNEENGLLYIPPGQAPNPQAQMFSDPNMATDMMKKNLSMIIPQTLTFAWVNFFFSGHASKAIDNKTDFRILLSFGQHGRELITSEVALRLLSILSGERAMPGWDSASPNNALVNLIIKVVPMENMNGRKIVEAGDACDRKNGRGVDLNRNWSVDWGKKEKDFDPYEEFPGTTPFSEPEAQIMRKISQIRSREIISKVSRSVPLHNMLKLLLKGFLQPAHTLDFLDHQSPGLLVL